MARSFLDAFSPAARLAYPALVRGVREGLSARAIGRAIRGAGLSISNEALFAIARREREVWTHGLSLRFLPKDVTPNPFKLPEALTRTLRSYAFTYEVRGVIAGTTSPVRINVTLSTDELLTPRQMEQMAAELAEQKGGRYGMEVEDVVLVSGLRAGTLGVL